VEAYQDVINVDVSATLQKQQLGKAPQAEILTRALAHTGIAALVDEATGHEKVRPQNALQKYLAQLVRKELAAWVKKFPDEFCENIYKLKGWVWPGCQRTGIVSLGTTPTTWSLSAPGLLCPRNEKGQSNHRLHQW
jgi:hypothetical protein